MNGMQVGLFCAAFACANVSAVSTSEAATRDARPPRSSAASREIHANSARRARGPASATDAPMPHADADKVTMERRPDGTRIYHLNGQGQEAIVARRADNGRIEVICADSIERALLSKERSHER